MILSSQSIRARVGLIEPFCERSEFCGMTYGLGPAGYDIRCRERVIIGVGCFCLASTVERVMIPPDLLVMITDKSTWARRGLAVQHTVIDPGFAGWITLELNNHGPEELIVEAGMPIAQAVFHRLDFPTEQPYRGKYHNQPARPVSAR